jgi:hypothetical protein
MITDTKSEKNAHHLKNSSNRNLHHHFLHTYNFSYVTSASLHETLGNVNKHNEQDSNSKAPCYCIYAIKRKSSEQ